MTGLQPLRAPLRMTRGMNSQAGRMARRQDSRTLWMTNWDTSSGVVTQFASHECSFACVYEGVLVDEQDDGNELDCGIRAEQRLDIAFAFKR